MTRSDDKKRLLADTLLDMVNKMPIDQITVSSITRACGLSRQTFYYHFSTLEELFAWTLRQELIETVKPVRGEGSLILLQAVLERVYANKELVDKIARYTSSSSSLNALLKQEVGIYVMRAVEEAAVGLNIAPSDRALIARFHTAGLLEIIRIWIEDGMRETPERLAARLSALVASSPELIERMGDTPRM